MPGIMGYVGNRMLVYLMTVWSGLPVEDMEAKALSLRCDLWVNSNEVSVIFISTLSL